MEKSINFLNADYFQLNNPIVDKNKPWELDVASLYFKCIVFLSKYQLLTIYICSLLFLIDRKYNF